METNNKIKTKKNQSKINNNDNISLEKFRKNKIITNIARYLAKNMTWKMLVENNEIGLCLAG